MSPPLQIIGRSSSHFTRVTRIFAHELAVPIELVPMHDIRSTESAIFAGNPALKIPTLRRGGELLFGTENICRAIAEVAEPGRRVVWPEQLRDDVSRNAQELVWHAMAAQVTLVIGTIVNDLPAAHPYFAKVRTGFEGAMGWLEQNLESAVAALPAERDLSLFEVTLFCLIEHIAFRRAIELTTGAHPKLLGFARQFGERPSALATPYGFDAAP